MFLFFFLHPSFKLSLTSVLLAVDLRSFLKHLEDRFLLALHLRFSSRLLQNAFLGADLDCLYFSCHLPGSTALPSGTSTTDSDLTGASQYGITFTPYTSSGDCMSQAQVIKSLQDIKAKGFKLVRVYSTDCNALKYIGSACKEIGMNIIIGVDIKSAGVSGAQEQVQEIVHWAQWSMVKLIVIGNEAISDGYCNASELASFLSSAKNAFEAAGYSGNVTTSEPVKVWQEYGSSELCKHVGIVGANIHPYFNSNVTAAQAGNFALSEYQSLERICGKSVLNLETGWPNTGDANGAAVPSVTEQETTIKAIAEAIGPMSVFFSYANDDWKLPGPFNVEQHWGCFPVFSAIRSRF